MSIGARLKEERERLGFNQTQFAALAEASKKTQIRWEQEGGGFPDAAALATWVEAGLDAVYVLTGERSAPNASAPTHLPPDEQLLLEAYRGLTAPARKALLAELLTGEKPKKTSRAKPAEGSVTVSGNGNRTAGGDYHEK